MPLREMEVRKAKAKDTAYRLTDGGGLHLLVKPNGSKLSQQPYRYADREKTLSHGAYPEVGIAEARLKCVEAKDLLDQRFDPSTQKKLDRIQTEQAKNKHSFRRRRKLGSGA